MSTLEDVRMHGASNRFLLHFGDEPIDALLQKLQGADGLLVVQESEIGDAAMKIFNADGGEAEQCGNGLRCVALHLVRSKLVCGNEVTIRTISGLNHCVVHEDHNEVEATLCVPKIEHHVVQGLPPLTYVDIGNPNAVLWTEEEPSEVRQQIAASISNHASFQNGMNVHIARRDGESNATCASWERGVGSTHASGTGGAAVFVASKATGTYFVSSIGGLLSYRYDSDGAVVMSGPANYE